MRSRLLSEVPAAAGFSVLDQLAPHDDVVAVIVIGHAYRTRQPTDLREPVAPVEGVGSGPRADLQAQCFQLEFFACHLIDRCEQLSAEAAALPIRIDLNMADGAPSLPRRAVV